MSDAVSQVQTACLVLTSAEYERLKPLLYHVVDEATQQRMAALRTEALGLAVGLLRASPPSRSQSLALTHLEDSLMRGIQSLALGGRAVLPPQFVVEGE